MSWTLKKIVQSIFMDFTMNGERVKTLKEFSTAEDGKRYLSKKSLLIEETGEILQENFYNPNSRKPAYTYLRRSYMLA
jgi:hypothetical protein